MLYKLLNLCFVIMCKKYTKTKNHTIPNDKPRRDTIQSISIEALRYVMTSEGVVALVVSLTCSSYTRFFVGNSINFNRILSLKIMITKQILRIVKQFSNSNSDQNYLSYEQKPWIMDSKIMITPKLLHLPMMLCRPTIKCLTSAVYGVLLRFIIKPMLKTESVCSIYCAHYTFGHFSLLPC